MSPRSRHGDELFPGLFVRQLEERLVLNGTGWTWDDAGQAVTIDAGTYADDGRPDTFQIARDGDDLRVLVNGAELYTAPLEEVATLSVSGSGDDDTLTVDLSGGDPAPAGGIAFQGMGHRQGGGDLLVVDRGSFDGPINTVTHRFGRVGDGFIDVTIGSSGLENPPSSIAYTGVESVNDLASADRLVFQSAPGDQTLTISDDGRSADGRSLLSSPGGTSVTFAQPAASLTIETGPAGTDGSQTVIIEGLDSLFSADMTIRGDGRDAILFSGDTDFGGSRLDATAGAIQVDGSIANQGGTVHLDAGDHGTLTVSETIDVSSFSTGHTGGTVHLLGDHVVLADDARVNASGDAGGGDVLVGGDYQGANPAIRNASLTEVARGAIVTSDASYYGDGGKVVVWADDTSSFHGMISARGGELGGDGGTVEVSGRQALTVTGHVDLRASNGHVGRLLLDPGGVRIVHGSYDSGPDVFGDHWINHQLGLGDLTISTNDSSALPPQELIVEADADIWWETASTLELIGNDAVVVHGSINGNTSGGLKLTGGAVQLGETQAGTLNVTAGGRITDTGNVTVEGAATFSAGAGNSDITLGDGTWANFGTLSLEGREVTVTEASATQLGAVEVFRLQLTSAGAITDTRHVAVDGAATFSAGAGNSDITLGDGTWANFGTLSLEGREVTVTEASATQLGAVEVFRLQLTSAGAITDTRHVAVDGAATFSAGAGNSDITLGDGTWANFGTLSLEGREVTVTEASATQLGAVEVFRLQLTSAGAITDTRHVAVDGAATFSAGAGNSDITLGDGTRANFGTLSLEGREVTVTEASATELSGVDVAQLTLTSAGPITDSGDIRVTAAAVFDAGANPITFGDRPSETTNFGSLALTAGDVSVAEHSSTLLGAVSVENLHLTSAGAITDSIDTEVTGVAVLNAGTNRITLGGQAGATTNFGRIELIGGSVNVLEDSDTLLVGADVDRLRYNSAGKIVIDGKVIKARGLLTLTAVGDIEVHDLPWLGAGLSEVVAGEIVFRAGGAIDIDNGAVLESATGKVTNAPPLLRIGELDPDDTIVPGDPTQELTGTVGGIEAQGDKLEQGANFTVAVVWDDGLRSELAGVSAGDKVVWRVREDGSSNAVITPGSGTGPIVVLVVREYGVDHLTTVTQTEMRAAVEVRNDPSIRLDDGSAVDLNAAHSAVVSRLSSQEIPQKEEPPEEAPPQVVGITAALEERELVVVPPPPLLAAEISTTPLLQKTPPERLRPGQGRVAEQLRELYIVKVVKAESGEQEQDEHYPLPEDALSDLNVLLERLKQEGLPNGWYRIYLKEKGLPRRRVLEFYKWGDQIGDYPREPGRGSNPAPEAGASNRADGAFPDATAGSRGVRREVVPLATTPVLAAEPAAAVEAEVDAGSRTGPLALPPHDDGRATAETAAATAWTRSLDEAMQSADDHSFTKAARLCRRLRR